MTIEIDDEQWKNGDNEQVLLFLFFQTQDLPIFYGEIIIPK